MIEAPIIVKKISRSTEATGLQVTKAQVPVSELHELQRFRESAWQTYESLPFPTSKDEAWRRTDLIGLHTDRYQMTDKIALANVPQELLTPLAGDKQDGQLILTSAGPTASLHERYKNQGVVFNSIQTIEKEQPELLVKLFGKVIEPGEGKFAALASAMAKDGVLLYVPRNVTIENPLHSIFWQNGDHQLCFSRVLVWLEEGASATFVHEYASPSEQNDDLMHIGLVEIHAGPSSHLKFVELQSWGPEVRHILHERAKVERDASVEWIFGAIGSRITKSFTDYDLVGQGSSIKISGFYFADGNQQLDHDTQQNHLVPQTTSDLLFKGAVSGKSRSVWQGMIYVAPGAFKTDGYQANRNIVLGKDARADSIPGLEILADDVRCTHGATVGKVDQEQVYYLQTRGLSRREAQRLVVEGFFEPVMDRIPFEGVQQRFRDAIEQKMDKIDALI